MSGSVHIKFRNKSEYSMTHMLNSTLVKLNMYDLSQFWMNSKLILLDRENIREFPELSSYRSIFFSWINIHEYFSFQAILYRDHILSCNGLLSFWVTRTQLIFFCTFSNESMETFVWKNNNQIFRFYSISPLGRNRIIFYINSVSPLVRNGINVWKTQ